MENTYTLEGTSLHERVDGGAFCSVGEVEQYRTVELISYHYGLIGKSDLIERTGNSWVPVEYKRGTKGRWGNDRIQVCAQALCLEEMLGVGVQTGAIFYAASGRRETFVLDQALRELTIKIIQQVRELLQHGVQPLPTLMPRCEGCSLQSACLPTLEARVRKYQEEVR